ncbi:acyl-CoA dehydrogenase [Longibacter salinarum]|uniref:Acyl-CoA dehydrogenase n=1 Tax=Longibacter salinarum TaxID=1850348 RepID=A0A2A8CWS6_9BACT|nr:acyl-CoA dehydrogenase family protein [Longibacter salinarum]PEN13071.1 acyl-CoA dehydrogenase [Longibacter salinarum]
MSIASYLNEDVDASVDFKSFRDAFKKKLRNVFHRRSSADQVGTSRGIPPFIMREIQSLTPLSVFIPEEHGGRGGHVHECQSILAAASYESLALSLTIGINGALFLQPLTKYGREEIKAPIFRRFIEDKNMGGLMITEPDYGTDALRMETSYQQQDDGSYRIQGTKHWGGLTGWADFWLVTARRKSESGNLGRDIDFFVADMNRPEQLIEVEELYENLGLYMIPYGRNKVDIRVPEAHRLQPESTGIKMMLDTLHRSRIEFPGMGMGFLQRMLDEAISHCRERFVGGKALLEYDQVKRRVAGIQAAYTACSAMCMHTSEHAGIENNLATHALPANSIKSVVTDMMQSASQSLLQLAGGKGYKLDHIAGRSTVDSRPFQIFEGSNDVLYQQIAESVLKSMRRMKERNLYAFASQHDLMNRASDYFKDALDVEVDMSLPQRKLVDLGRILGRVITMEMTIEMGDRGFRSDLISNALSLFRSEVKGMISSFQDRETTDVIEDYGDNSSWLDLVRPQNA